MEEENSDAMNLNLDPGPSSELESMDIQALLEENNNDAMNLDVVLGPSPEPTFRSITSGLSQREARHADFIQCLVNFGDPDNIDLFGDFIQCLVNFGDGHDAFEVGEGSETREKKQDVIEKGKGFFECSICLDVAKDPVVTACGHLFCWRCLFQWCHVHSTSNECPNCKGEVNLWKVTPIYGRGNHAYVSDEQEDSDLEIIPPRPQARRVNRLRQTLERNIVPPPYEEMVQRIHDLTQDLVDLLMMPEPINAHHEQAAAEIDTPLLRRLLTSQGMRNEQNSAAPLQQDPPLVDDIDSLLSNIENFINSESDMINFINNSGSDMINNDDVEMNSEVPNVDDEDSQAPRLDV